MEPFIGAVREVGRHMAPDALVIVETTVPPGTTKRLVAPALFMELARRGEDPNRFMLAHCYERVMPGAGYLGSIIKMPRVYAGIDDRSADTCDAFLRSIVDPSCPPTRVSSTTASELAKVLENSYRAVTIALMDEFAVFAEAAGVDLTEVIAPIRMRPTHSNMRVPGFGVGGYCLTKDPLLARIAARDLFGLDHQFPFCTLAIETNCHAPLRVLAAVRGQLGGSVAGKRILLLGVSYRQDVDDTRSSASEAFLDAATEAGAMVLVNDPLVRFWRERNLTVDPHMPPAAGVDAVVFAVPHHEYRAFDFRAWAGASRPLFYDAFQVLTSVQIEALRAAGCVVECIGRGSPP